MSLNVDYLQTDGSFVRACPEPWRELGETDWELANRAGLLYGFPDGWSVYADTQGNLLLHPVSPDPAPGPTQAQQIATLQQQIATLQAQIAKLSPAPPPTGTATVA